MEVVGLSLDKSFSDGFSMQLMEDVTNNCETIFTVQDIIYNFPVFSISSNLHALRHKLQLRDLTASLLNIS